MFSEAEINYIKPQHLARPATPHLICNLMSRQWGFVRFTPVNN
jgi:hypothetical protein